jgi:hypothetical protein
MLIVCIFSYVLSVYLPMSASFPSYGFWWVSSKSSVFRSVYQLPLAGEAFTSTRFVFTLCESSSHKTVNVTYIHVLEAKNMFRYDCRK